VAKVAGLKKRSITGPARVFKARLTTDGSLVSTVMVEE
jgi:hypothetical protein